MTYRPTTRRTFVKGAVTTVAAGSLLAACGDDDDEGGGSSTAGAEQSGPWTFKDDKGVTQKLDSAPTKIVAYDTAASALLYLGIKPIAVFGSAPLKDNYLFDAHDTSDIVELGTAYGEINLDRLASLDPQIIVAPFNPEQDVAFGFKDDAQFQKAVKFAPLVAINGVKLPTQVIDRFVALATSLGADQQAPEQANAKQAFDAAVKALMAATRAKKGVTVEAVSPLEDGLYVAKTDDFPALKQYKQWGVEFLSGTGKDDFWEILSYEQADKYQPDLLMRDITVGALSPKDLEAKPAWRQLEAVKAGHQVEWTKLESWSYPLYTKEISDLTAGLQKADPDLVAS